MSAPRAKPHTDASAPQTRATRFACGQRVRAAIDLGDDAMRASARNDPRRVTRGTPGNVVGVGRHVRADAAVYLVEFAGAIVVGCREGELDAEG